jgi:hypothetical protein
MKDSCFHERTPSTNPRSHAQYLLFPAHTKYITWGRNGVLVVDRLIGRGPEVEADIRWTGGSPGPLGHENDDHILSGIGIPGGAQTAIPAQTAGHRRDVVASGDHRDAEPP